MPYTEKPNKLKQEKLYENKNYFSVPVYDDFDLC